MRFFGKKRASPKRAAGRDSQSRASSQRVISYYTASRRQLDNFERSAIYNQDKAAGRRFTNIFGHYWFMIFCLGALLIIAGYSCLLSDNPHVDVSGPSYRAISAYQKISRDTLKDDFRNRFKFSLMSEKAEGNLLKSMPEAESVAVKSSLLGHRPEIKIFTANYMALFSQGQTSFLLSDRGKLLIVASESIVDVSKLPVIRNQTGTNAKVGEQFMSPSEAGVISRILAQYKADGVIPTLILPTVLHELNVREPGRGYYVRFQLNEEIDSQYGALRATEKKLQELGQSPAEYIDVRLSSKAYFK